MTNKEPVRSLYNTTLEPGVGIIRGVVAEAVADNVTPIPNSRDAQLVEFFNDGRDTEFTRLAFEIQIKHAQNVAREKKSKKVENRDELTPLAKKAATKATETLLATKSAKARESLKAGKG
ncbi:hypothetical protein PG993_011944 [Apiospora rasikravindrae]|uniref:Uncharacterized protein n=1 Tax=Apiospora rasikravindrae TaxID=990691 RepID=A0ABR1S172_9PEZI